MLTVDQVDEVWGVVVRAMEKGELGDVAKVATDDGGGDFPPITPVSLARSRIPLSSSLRIGFNFRVKAAVVTRKLNPMRRELERGILDLARETGVIGGKWMLFPTKIKNTPL
jgi:hypothetical protein